MLLSVAQLANDYRGACQKIRQLVKRADRARRHLPLPAGQHAAACPAVALIPSPRLERLAASVAGRCVVNVL
jgi:hypothetical protein